MDAESCRGRCVESEDGEEFGMSRCGWTLVARVLFLHRRTRGPCSRLSSFGLVASEASIMVQPCRCLAGVSGGLGLSLKIRDALACASKGMASLVSRNLP
jgi:hypothetical protein